MYTREERMERDSLPLERVSAENWVRAIQLVASKQTAAVIVAQVIDHAKQFQIEDPK